MLARTVWLKWVAAAVVLPAIVTCGSAWPAGLSDNEFWKLSERVSEPAGTFALADNYVSNEAHFAETVRWLTPRGGVYVGVGPEQNFSFVARLRPALAFIVDIRRENLDLHLLYKALFEVAGDRVDFVSRLFSRPRPAGLKADASVEEIFDRYATVPSDARLRESTFALVRERLLNSHHFPVTAADLVAIEAALRAFHADGPDIQYWRARPRGREAGAPSYRQLMTTRDLGGQLRSFLASEKVFALVRDLESRNLIVPVVGDFGGATALRGIGDYVRAHGGLIEAFYGSNVGVYLDARQMRAFCGNLASLPVSSGAWFVESDGMRLFSARLKACGPLHR
jgi:hypothetical protein